MTRLALFALLAGIPAWAAGTDPGGSICIGADLSPAPPPKGEIYIRVGAYEPIPFYASRGQVGLKGVDRSKRHLIRLTHDGKQFASWWLDFKKLKTESVLIWKAYGAWKMIPIGGSQCEWPHEKVKRH